ncbi:MAG: hypothetical protein V8T38_15090 [Oscillospiraceae bacterium]
MLTFDCRVTKNGNLKLTKQTQDILGVSEGDTVKVSVYGDGIRIPQEILDTAGLDADGNLEIYADDGVVVVQEADEDE